MLTKFARFSAIALCSLLIAGCGGGGGDDNDGSDGGLGTDSCSVLGLKIINGSECGVSQSPVVSYVVSYSDSPGTSCSGTLISSTDVITAGHCFRNEGNSVVAIGVSVEGVTVDAKSFAIHPQYEDLTQVGGGVLHDVAIIRLNSPVTTPTVPILVSKPVVPGDVIDIFGFGIDENGDFGELKSGQMLVNAIDSQNLISEFTGDGSNTCQGDSGGPAILTVNGVTGIVGVTSTGVASAACLVGDISTFSNLQNQSNLNFILGLVPSAGRV